MVRTQVQLTEEQARALRSRARELGVSLAEVIRRCVDEALAGRVERSELYGRAARLVGRFPDREGAADLAARHDDYLGQAFE